MEAEFWHWSYFDLEADLKAVINLVHERTQQQVALFSFSMGTTTIFSAFSNDYAYFRDKVYKVIG